MKVIVRANDKTIEMEKYLFRKGNQWKVVRYNFKISNDNKVTDKLISDLQKEIDKKMLGGSP